MALIIFLMVLCVITIVNSTGMLLLYQPKDITNDCAFSRYLRFDISFGMGMSDTITLVFRTINDLDYECLVEVVTPEHQYLVVVVRYPTTIAKNCEVNRDALTVLKRRRCTRLCDLLVGEAYSPYFTFTVQNRIRFLFKSNSSINSDINANFYQVTITSARQSPTRGCNRRNETICTVDRRQYCFTTGVVCDGIKNCGVEDWFDERMSQCTLPVQRLGYAPIVAVAGALVCGVVAGCHALLRILPPNANSFFIFNENEDNRLRVDPVLAPRGNAPNVDAFERVSIIPVFDSISSETDTTMEESQITTEEEKTIEELEGEKNVKAIEIQLPEPEENSEPNRKSTMKYIVTKKFQKLIGVRHFSTPAGPSQNSKGDIA